MSKLWDDLKDNMKDWSLTAVEKAEEMSKIAVAKTEEMTLISKLKFEIHQLHREMNQVYENLGRLAYKHTKNEHMASFSGNKEFFDLVNLSSALTFKIPSKSISKVTFILGSPFLALSISESTNPFKKILSEAIFLFP